LSSSFFFSERRNAFMLKCLCSLAAALLILGSATPAGLAKPPDLPVDVSADFEEVDMWGSVTLGFDPLTGKLSLSLSLPWRALQDWLPECLAPVEPKVVSRERQSSTLAQGHRLFEIAEHCLKQGDFEMARTCYEETHLLAPQTSYGRRSIQRLSDLDRLRIGDSAGRPTRDK
jgi:hypothetical protein